MVAFVLLLFGLFSLIIDLKEPEQPLTAVAAPLFETVAPTSTPYISVVEVEIPEIINEEPTITPTAGVRSDMFSEIRLPYTSYTLTQGPHGGWYGDAAIDLTAGKGAAILAPINGVVTTNGYDEWGNTALIIENDNWQVKLLHGRYIPDEGEWIAIGQIVGAESNQGYTIDIYGRSCRGRDCGYHTHMNVFDKRSGENADIMQLLNP